MSSFEIDLILTDSWKESIFAKIPLDMQMFSKKCLVAFRNNSGKISTLSFLHAVSHGFKNELVLHHKSYVQLTSRESCKEVFTPARTTPEELRR